MAAYYNGLRSINGGNPVVHVVEGKSRRRLTLPDGRSSFGWFNLGGGVGNLARAILTDAGGEESTVHAPEFGGTVVVYLHGSSDFERHLEDAIVHHGGETYSEQWRLPVTRVRAWVAERSASDPLETSETEETEGFPQPNEEMLKNTGPDSIEEQRGWKYVGMRPTELNGFSGDCHVEVRKLRSYRGSYDLMHVSTSSTKGFEWGYGGAGPDDLATSILADAAGTRAALQYSGAFLDEVVRHLPSDVDPQRDADFTVEWEIPEKDVLAWLESKRGTGYLDQMIYQR